MLGKKGFFSYEHGWSLGQLEEPQVPPREAFQSWLRKSELSKEDYAICQRAWAEKGTRTLRDFLVWYNNLYVLLFLEALHKMSQFWRRYGTNMLKEAISLPGLAFKFKMSLLREQGLYLSSFLTEDLYQLFKDNLVGGPTIIFHRHAEKSQTKIRHSQYGQAARPVQRVVGYDANALYLWALSQHMPVGLFTTWIPCGDGLEPTKCWRVVDEWLAWVGRGIVQFHTRLDQGEKRIGSRQLPVDCYDAASQTAYEFHGCYWHGHRYCLTAKKFSSTEGDPDSPQSIEFLNLMREKENGGEEAIPGGYSRPDGGVDQRMLVVSSKMGRQTERHGDLSRQLTSMGHVALFHRTGKQHSRGGEGYKKTDPSGEKISKSHRGFFCVCNFNNKHNHSFFPAPLSVFLYLDLLPLLL